MTDKSKFQMWFIADTHFGHSNVIKYVNRPFADVDEMDEAMIANWNSVVKPNDEVYHLGDFAFRDPYHYGPRLNGKKFLVPGNHDRKYLGELKKYFHILPTLYEMNHEKKTLVMCHYAMRRWNKAHWGTYHIYGHSHGSLPGEGRSFDVGVDCWNFTPISWDMIVEKMEAIPFEAPKRDSEKRDI
jgi:calcineurin-like phosphoesterase family protein